MTLFNNKYRIESTRLKDWDYSSAGWYFVKICTYNKECFFGNVIDSPMSLSVIGEIVAAEWLKTPTIRQNVELDAWVVMPNHLHGIVIINNPDNTVKTPHRGVSNTGSPTSVSASESFAKNESGISGTETRHRRVSTKPRLASGSLGAMVNQFKSVCTKQIRGAGNERFDWQSRFYDHIIRNDKSLKEIREYIFNNPAKWELDKNNPANLWM